MKKTRATPKRPLNSPSEPSPLISLEESGRPVKKVKACLDILSDDDKSLESPCQNVQPPNVNVSTPVEDCIDGTASRPSSGLRSEMSREEWRRERMLVLATRVLTPRFGETESPKIARQIVALGSRYSVGPQKSIPMSPVISGDHIKGKDENATVNNIVNATTTPLAQRKYLTPVKPSLPRKKPSTTQTANQKPNKASVVFPTVKPKPGLNAKNGEKSNSSFPIQNIQPPGVEAFQVNSLGVCKKPVSAATARRLARSVLTPVSKRYSMLGYRRTQAQPEENKSSTVKDSTCSYDPKLPRYLQPTRSSMMKAKPSNLSMMVSANESNLRLNSTNSFAVKGAANSSAIHSKNHRLTASKIPVFSRPVVSDKRNSFASFCRTQENGNVSEADLRKHIASPVSGQPGGPVGKESEVSDKVPMNLLNSSFTIDEEHSFLNKSQMEIETARDSKADCFDFTVEADGVGKNLLLKSPCLSPIAPSPVKFSFSLPFDDNKLCYRDPSDKLSFLSSPSSVSNQSGLNDTFSSAMMNDSEGFVTANNTLNDSHLETVDDHNKENLNASKSDSFSLFCEQINSLKL